MQDFDHLSLQELRRRGSLKWTGKTFENEPLWGAWVAEMDFGTAPAVARCLHRAIDDGFFGYMPPLLANDVQRETGRFLAASYGWQVSAEDVFISSDVLSILRAQVQLATKAGEAVVVPTPAYMPFLTIPTQAGRDLIEVKSRYYQGRWELDFAALENALSQEKAKLLVLCNPWNPTGRVLSEAELRKVGQLALAHKVTVFADEIHAPLVLTDKARHIPFASLDPDFSQITVTAHAASKGWNLAGLHCAQMILPPSPLRDRFEESGLTTQLAMGATPLGALATRAAYQEGGAWLQEIKAYIRENLACSRDLALQIAPQLQIPEVEGTYLSLWDASSYGENPVKIAEEKARVGVNGGEILGSGYPGLLRLNAATPRYLFLEMTWRLASALREAEND